ncbi:MAG: hypothetical protein ACE5DM_01210 [Candidatus Nanoarchaeia archaeon]
MVEAHEHFDSTRLKRFITHLAVAQKKIESKQEREKEVRGHVEKLKAAVRLEKPGPAISDAVNALDKSLHQVLSEESYILEQQKVETKTVSEMKEKLESLNQKLIGLGMEYTDQLSEKDSKMKELEDSLAKANTHIDELEQNRDERRERLAQVEQKIKAHHEEKKNQAIIDIEQQLKSLEKTHKKLEKSGKHKKKDLSRLKKLIEAHKQKLAKLK